MTAQGRFSDVSKPVPSIWVKREEIRTGDVFRWCFDYAKRDWDTVTVLAAASDKLMVQREKTGVAVEIPTPSRLEVIGRDKSQPRSLWLNDTRPVLYPGALPDGTGEVLQHLAENHGIPNWKNLNRQQIAALGALVRAGYVKRTAYHQYR